MRSPGFTGTLLLLASNFCIEYFMAGKLSFPILCGDIPSNVYSLQNYKKGGEKSDTERQTRTLQSSVLGEMRLGR